MFTELTRYLGRTGVLVSPLALGTMNFGRWTEQKESLEIIGTALDAGLTVIDTADVYGHGASEEIVPSIRPTSPGCTTRSRKSRSSR